MNKRRKPLDTALIVEDEPLIAAGLEAALRDKGITNIHIYASASDALAAFGSVTPDLLVMDVQLVDSQAGHDLAEVALEVFSPPPHIIFSTGSPERIPADLAKVGRLFAKPYDFDALAAYAAAL